MASIALSMIVRDAGSDLGACLESAAGVVDEIVIVDTGSRDNTIEIARGAGANVFTIPWDDDFAGARNQALGKVNADWVLVLDADERLDPDASRTLPRLTEEAGVGGYLVTIRNYVLDLDQRLWDRPALPNTSKFPAARKYPAYVEHENVRLFRRDPEIYFEGRVHETVGSRIQASGRLLHRAPFLIHHFGMTADRETRARKNRLYRELGRRKAAEMPSNAQAQFELGLVELDNFHNDREALECFKRACRLDPGLSVAWFFTGLTQVRLELFDDALVSLKQAAVLGHAPALVAETRGDALYNLGRFEEACSSYRHALREAGDSAALESKLGLAEVRARRIGSGLERMRRATEREPRMVDGHDRLILANIWLGRHAAAADAAERKLAHVELRPEYFIRAASIHMQMGLRDRAEEVLRSGLALFPDAGHLRQGLAEVQAADLEPIRLNGPVSS